MPGGWRLGNKKNGNKEMMTPQLGTALLLTQLFGLVISRVINLMPINTTDIDSQFDPQTHIHARTPALTGPVFLAKTRIRHIHTLPRGLKWSIL